MEAAVAGSWAAPREVRRRKAAARSPWAEGLRSVPRVWRPARVLLGAYLFGGVTMLQFHLQGNGVDVPSQFLAMLPYIATIVVLALISRNPQWIRINMPASIGKPFYPGA